MGRRSPARPIAVGCILALLACVAAAGSATAQDQAVDPLQDRILRLRGATLRLVYQRGGVERLARFREAITWVESEADQIVRILGARPGAHPALAALAQGEVLEAAWSLVEHAVLVDVPPEHERALRRAVGERVVPLRCQAIDHYLTAVRLSSSDAGAASIRWAAVDRLATHGDDIIRRCWARATR